jgi:hypothetical protein
MTELAALHLSGNPDTYPLEDDLAHLGKDDTWRAFELSEKLANLEPAQDEGEIKTKWLFLALAWLFEHRDEYDDPLEMVEAIYAQFDYPHEIEQFVRYIPTAESVYDAGAHSHEENISRLFTLWREYIDGARLRYSSSDSSALKGCGDGEP